MRFLIMDFGVLLVAAADEKQPTPRRAPPSISRRASVAAVRGVGFIPGSDPVALPKVARFMIPWATGFTFDCGKPNKQGSG